MAQRRSARLGPRLQRIVALTLGGLPTLGCVDSKPPNPSAPAVVPCAAPGPQLALRHGEDLELLDPATGDRWITAWYGGSIFCDVVGDEVVSPDGRFVAIETALSGSNGADRRFACRVLDVAKRRWSSSPDLDRFATSFAFSHDGARIVLRSGQSLTDAFQTIPLLEGDWRGEPGPIVWPSYMTSPATTLIALDGRRAFVLLERREGLGPATAELVVLDLVHGGERTIELCGSATSEESQLVEDSATGAILASTWHFGPDPSADVPDARLVHELFRVDVERGTATLIRLPSFTGRFTAAAGRLVASCRDGDIERLFALDLASAAGGFLDDGGVFDRLEPRVIDVSPDGRYVAVFAEAPPRVDAQGSVRAADAPSLFLVGEVGDVPDHVGRIIPLACDVTPASWHPQPLESSRNLRISFSPNNRWLAVAYGGFESGGEFPIPVSSWLRVIDLERGRVAQRIDGGIGVFPFVGWCVASKPSDAEW